MTMTLYYAQAAVSFVPHLLLEELELPHRAERVTTADDSHRTPEFLRLNPLGQVPVLVLEDGRALTQTLGILEYLRALRPDASLVPEDPFARARAYELLGVLATVVQPAFAMHSRPDRWVSSPEAQSPLSVAARARAERGLRMASALLADLPASEGPGLADGFAALMALWAGHWKVDIADCRPLLELAGRVRQRPAFARTLRVEGLVDAEGRPTPPDRV